jgi:uncharacterized protein (TIGR03435 family)
VTIAMFASVLSGNAGRTVIDRTGLAGSFDIELNFDPSSTAQSPPGAPPGPQPIDDSKPSIFTALQEQLGLNLEPTRAPSMCSSSIRPSVRRRINARRV